MGNFEIILEKSRSLTLFFFLLYSSSFFICIWWVPFIVLKLIILMVLLMQAWKTISQHARRTSKQAIVRVWQNSKGEWGCQTRDGHGARGILKNDSFKSRWFIILNFRLYSSFFKRSTSVIIPFDAVNSSEYRALCNRFNQHKSPINPAIN